MKQEPVSYNEQDDEDGEEEEEDPYDEDLDKILEVKTESGSDGRPGKTIKHRIPHTKSTRTVVERKRKGYKYLDTAEELSKKAKITMEEAKELKVWRSKLHLHKVEFLMVSKTGEPLYDPKMEGVFLPYCISNRFF